MALRDMLNKDDPVAKRVMAYTDSKEFKRELDKLSERVRLGLTPEEYKKYKEGSGKHEIQ